MSPEPETRQDRGIHRESWGSRFGFIAATVGFSVGLGNIWRFPYLTGTSGGGAFLAAYLVLAVLVGIPLFTAEIALGRRSRLSPIAGMARLTGSRLSPWNLIGWLGVATAFLLMTYYPVIVAWIAAYFLEAATGAFTGRSVAEMEAAFATFVEDPVGVLAWAAVVLAAVGGIVARGLRQGVERAARWLLPLLFLFLVALAAGSLTFDGAMRGVDWYLRPDFSDLDARTVLDALGQVFYSVGVGMAAAFAYGSYLHPAESDIPGGSATIVAFDTLAAVLAGLAIFPAVFAFGLEPDAGPGLLFVTMSSVFARAPAGQLAGAAFFLLVLTAGLTSAIAVVEALVATAMDSLGWSRRRALWTLLGVVYLASIPPALSFGPWADVRLLGADIFTFVDRLSGSVLLPLGGLLIALYVAFEWGFDGFREEANRGAGRIRVERAWRPFVRWLIPAAVALVLLGSLGVL